MCWPQNCTTSAKAVAEALGIPVEQVRNHWLQLVNCTFLDALDLYGSRPLEICSDAVQFAMRWQFPMCFR